MRRLKRAVQYARAGQLRLLANAFARRLYSDRTHIGLRLDTSAFRKASPERYSLSVRRLEGQDSMLFEVDAAKDDDAFDEFMNNVRLFEAGIQTGYVAVTPDGEVCLAQWLIDHTQNDKLHALYGDLYRPLSSEEALLEAMFTFRPYRGRGIVLYALPELVSEAERLGARWLFSYPSAGDKPTIRILERAGFVPAVLRRESYRFLRRRVTFTQLPEGATA